MEREGETKERRRGIPNCEEGEERERERGGWDRDLEREGEERMRDNGCNKRGKEGDRKGKEEGRWLGKGKGTTEEKWLEKRRRRTRWRNCRISSNGR